MTSWAPTVAFRNPAMPAHRPPTIAAATMATVTCRNPGSESSDVPIQTAAIVPTMYCPCPPMLNSPQRKAKATASPVRTSTVNWMSVCWRLIAG